MAEEITTIKTRFYIKLKMQCLLYLIFFFSFFLFIRSFLLFGKYTVQHCIHAGIGGNKLQFYARWTSCLVQKTNECKCDFFLSFLLFLSNELSHGLYFTLINSYFKLIEISSLFFPFSSLSPLSQELRGKKKKISVQVMTLNCIQ